MLPELTLLWRERAGAETHSGSPFLQHCGLKCPIKFIPVLRPGQEGALTATGDLTANYGLDLLSFGFQGKQPRAVPAPETPGRLALLVPAGPLGPTPARVLAAQAGK